MIKFARTLTGQKFFNQLPLLIIELRRLNNNLEQLLNKKHNRSYQDANLVMIESASKSSSLPCIINKNP